jgi:hypothetical protein
MNSIGRSARAVQELGHRDVLDPLLDEGLALGQIAGAGVEALRPALRMEGHRHGALATGLVLGDLEQPPAGSRSPVAALDRHPLQLALVIQKPQATGCDHAGLVEGDDLGRPVVEPVELHPAVDALLIAEDPDPEVHRRPQLGVVACRPHGERQPAAGAQAVSGQPRLPSP